MSSTLQDAWAPVEISEKCRIRPFHGPNRGNLEWRRPTMLSIRQVVEHPMYAGAYAYGRRPHQRIRTATGERTRQGNWVPMEQWKVLKRDCLPAYITWERYLGFDLGLM